MNARMTWEQAVQWLREQPDMQGLVQACYFDDPLAQAAERPRDDQGGAHLGRSRRESRPGHRINRD